MVDQFRKVLMTFPGLLMTGLLSGCEVLSFMVPAVYNTPSIHTDPTYTGVNHYEPVILESDKGMIRVQYLDVNEYAQPEQAMQLIEEHCHGAFVVTGREKEGSRTVISADCG
jgi:hypothetical protein